jgi:photosystem II stability/assembly factor-like uncharacterized protein
MKTRLITIFILLIFTQFSRSDWQPQVSGLTDHLKALYFINENTGWAAGYNGKVLRTTNGGTNWVLQPTATTQTLFTVDFVNSNSGFIIGSLNTFLKTTNAGVNWVSGGGVPNMTSTNDVDFIDANTGYVCGADGDVSKTTNGGANWTKYDLTTIDFFRIKAIDASTVFVAGISGTIYKTANGGANWVLQPTGSNNYISGIVFSDNTNGYFTTLGLIEQVYRTTNGGTVWTQVSSPGNTGGLNGLAIVNSSTVYGVGSAGTIRRTTSSGTSWETQPSGVTNYLNAIFMVNQNVGFIAGDSGRILKTTNGGIGIKQISTNIPRDYSLSQNYPNPFNPLTNIEFSVPKAGHVKITVFDISGRETGVIADQYLSTGTYKADFDAANISSGIYFYRLVSADFSVTRKMVIVK